MRLDVATVLVQWAAGGLAFLWVTTRRREVSAGYGWLLRSVFGAMALGGAIAGAVADDAGAGASVRDLGAALMALAALVALAVSVARRGAGVAGHEELRARRRARVAAMVGDARPVTDAPDRPPSREFPPALDLPAPILGVLALLGAAAAVGGPYPLSAARLLVGAAFLGAVTDAMLLGHWYLTQPGLRRDPLRELVACTAAVWPVEVALLLVPTGMGQVLGGSIDDGYGGLIGWMWLACALGTGALLGATWLALRERSYSAVMAATGLLYLAILTAFVTDLMARAVLA